MAENKQLSDFFKDIITKTEAEGYPPIVVRESFDCVAPPLAWQHNWLILFVLAAGTLFGLLLAPLAILGSVFMTGMTSYAVIGLLYALGGLLLYFALSAFNIHEWAKLLFTLFVSLLVAATAFLAHTLATNVIGDLYSNMTFLNTQADAAVAMGAASSGSLESSLLQTVVSPLISVQVLLLLILIGYNLWPLLFWAKEKLEAQRKMEKKA